MKEEISTSLQSPLVFFLSWLKDNGKPALCYAKNYASIINKSLIAVGRGGEGRGGGRKELENANEIA